MFLATSSLITTVLLHSSLVAAHARLGTLIPGYGRIQNVDPGADRSPASSICRGLHTGAGNDRRTPLRPGGNRFDLDPNMAPHGGGSMQASLSFDGGATFKVLKSFIGGFPRNSGGNIIDRNQIYDFFIPDNTLAGPAIFSWSWSPEQGNPEWQHDCAPVTIEGGGQSRLEDFPNMFIANTPLIRGSCKAEAGVSVDYPNPGRDVERGNARLKTPTGCGGGFAAAAKDEGEETQVDTTDASDPTVIGGEPQADTSNAPTLPMDTTTTIGEEAQAETTNVSGLPVGTTSDHVDTSCAVATEDGCETPTWKQGTTVESLGLKFPQRGGGGELDPHRADSRGNPIRRLVSGSSYGHINADLHGRNHHWTNLEPGHVIFLRKRSRVMNFQ